MKSLIKSEVQKLITTRMLLGVLIGVVAINVMAVFATGDQALAELERPFHEQQWVFITATLMRLFLLVLGIRAVTDEFRHGTITPTLLTEPRRTKVVAAKAITLAGVGLIIAAIGEGTLLLAAAGRGALGDTALQLTAGDLPVLVGAVGAGALWAVLGVGLGTILRSQIAPIVGGLIWLMGIEETLRNRLDDLAGYLPGQAGIAVAIAPSTEVLLKSSLTLAIYALVAWVAGAIVMRTRDIS